MAQVDAFEVIYGYTFLVGTVLFWWSMYIILPYLDVLGLLLYALFFDGYIVCFYVFLRWLYPLVFEPIV